MARALGLLVCFVASSADAYITAPVQVEKFNREKGVIIYRKVRDLKGQYPKDRIRHAFDLQNTPLHKGLGDVPVRRSLPSVPGAGPRPAVEWPTRSSTWVVR